MTEIPIKRERRWYLGAELTCSGLVGEQGGVLRRTGGLIVDWGHPQRIYTADAGEHIIDWEWLIRVDAGARRRLGRVFDCGIAWQCVPAIGQARSDD